METIEEHENRILEQHKAIREGNVKSGIKCPDCGAELIYPDSIIFVTNPPMRKIECQSCGFTKDILC